MKKRLTAWLLMLLIALQALPMQAWASDVPETTEAVEQSNPQTEQAEAVSSDEDVELFALSVVSTVVCSRTVKITASSSSKFFLYLSATATSKSQHNYSTNVTINCKGYVKLSDGSVRYYFNATNSTDNVTYTYYFELSSKATLSSTNHTYGSAESAHPHYKTCGCGTSVTSTNSSCLQCYPSSITYYANGGRGAPSSQTVTSSPVTISSTIPTRFPYSFAGWGTSSSSSSVSYYSGKSYTVSAGKSLSLYAVWKSPVVLSTTTSASSSVTISNKNSEYYFSFTPTETASYVFESAVTGDTHCYLYDAQGNQLSYHDDISSSDLNFRIVHDLTAGSTYYYKVKWRSSTVTGQITVKLLRQYDVSFDANGGSGAPDAQKKTHGEAITLDSKTPIKDLLAFAGWADTDDAQQAQYQAGGSYDAEGDSTLYAVWAYPSGSCGENAVWVFADNCLKISGTGAMTDFSAGSDVPWQAYAGNISRVEIEEGITSVGSYAFADCTNLQEIVLPESIRTIGKYAFHNCESMKTLSIPEGVEAIEEYTFHNCASLASLQLPSTLKTIGAYSLFGCSALQELVLPSSVNKLGEYAFANCSSLTTINLPNGITVIPARLFSSNSSLSEIVIPGTVETIEEFAFEGCAVVSEIIIPGSVKEIARGAFSSCKALRKVTIPDGVTEIGTSIFAYVSGQVTVRCYLDTPIYQYVRDNGISYELMNWGKLEAPSFIRKAIANGVSVEISVPKGEIHYTVDGSEPSEKSPLYTQPITAQSNFTIKAIAVSEGWETSDVSVCDTALSKVATPTANYPSGSSVEQGTQIELSCSTEGATILCTTNGELPSEADVYTGPITITEETTIFAVALKDGMLKSSLAYFTYEIGSSENALVVTTLEASNVTENSAVVAAELENADDVVYVDFVYYEKNNSKQKYTVVAADDYTAVLTGLAPGTEYWFQARAVNQNGWSSGYICSFMTESTDETKPAYIMLDPSYLALNVGQTKTILATVLPITADNRDIYWTSEDKSVATVSPEGVVTATGIGDTRIKATTVSNRLVAYCNIKVISSSVDGTFDFSEHNMITNSSHYDAHGFDHSPSAGGNALMASAYLARWDGAVLEVNDPYPNSPADIKYREADADYHVQNILYLPYRNVDAANHVLDTEEIKSAIMKYGAVYTAFKVNYSYFSDNQTNYYLPENVRQYDGGHAVVIVGWDDHYPKTAFSEIAPGNGAFICKNSWGTGSGEDGYFYVSYYDKYIARATCGDYNAVFYDMESKENYNKIYQYDYLGPVATQTLISKEALIANVFPEKGSALTEDESLEAVSFYNYAPGTAYEVYVVTDYANKMSLKNLGEPVKTGVLEYAGYFTVELEESILLEAGTRFAVVVKYIPTTGNTTVFVEVPTTIPSAGGEIKHSFNAKANADESYVSNNGKSWIDYTAQLSNANVCVKAFTKTSDADVLLQGIDNIGRYYEDDTVYSWQELVEMGYDFNPALTDISLMDDEQNSEGNFGFIAPTIIPDLNTNNNYSEGCALPSYYDLRQEGCMTPVKNQGEIGSCWSFATYASLESAIKKAASSAMSLSSDGLNQSSGTVSKIELDQDGLLLALGDVCQLVATVTPFDSDSVILWKSSDPSVAHVSAYGLITTVKKGNTVITAYTADGKTSAECYVTVKEPDTLRSITIDNEETEVTAGESLLLEYSFWPSYATEAELTWESSDKSVATVNEYGLLSAKRNGTVEIRVSALDGTIAYTYTIDVVGGSEVYADIGENTLQLENGTLTGALVVDLGNSTGNTYHCMILVAVYGKDGQLAGVYSDTASLGAENVSCAFENISMQGLGTDAEVRVFVFEQSESYEPITDYCKVDIKGEEAL